MARKVRNSKNWLVVHQKTVGPKCDRGLVKHTDIVTHTYTHTHRLALTCSDIVSWDWSVWHRRDKAPPSCHHNQSETLSAEIIKVIITKNRRRKEGRKGGRVASTSLKSQRGGRGDVWGGGGPTPVFSILSSFLSLRGSLLLCFNMVSWENSKRPKELYVCRPREPLPTHFSAPPPLMEPECKYAQSCR